MREAQPPASSDAQTGLKSRLLPNGNVWMKGKIPESGQNPRMDLRPAARAWLPLRAPKRKFSKFRFQCPLGSEGDPTPAGICAQGAQRAGKPPTWAAGAAFPPGTNRSPTSPPVPAPAPRPLGGAHALVGASRAQTKATAEPRRQIEPGVAGFRDRRTAPVPLQGTLSPGRFLRTSVVGVGSRRRRGRLGGLGR